ncbi:MAG: flagellar basal body-associated FliL family protein [Lachnospiraceae bacterium]|nr:flagellar basal body-associated FliL family protein [Lachnospiraceae bacterium]
MKRNLLSILILALLIVNVVLTAIMMFSVTSTTKKTAALVDNISSALALELSDPGASAVSEAASVDMEDVQPYEIADAMTIPLTTGEDGEAHYCVVSVALSMNTKDPGDKTYGADLTTRESLIKSEIIDVIGSYTLEEAKADQDGMKKEILSQIQAMFDSEFIFDVSFSSIMYQ